MIKKIVCFGCSWTFGSELISPDLTVTDLNQAEYATENQEYRRKHAYPGLVADAFNLDLVDLSFPGSSLESMRWNFLWWCKQNACLADSLLLFGLTDAIRQSWYNPTHRKFIGDPLWNNHVHSAWLTQKNNNIEQYWYDLQKLWLSASCDRKWAEHNFTQAITLFDYARVQHKLPVIQVNMLPNSYASSVPSLLYPNLSFKEILTQQQKTLDQTLFAPGGHPNENGHKLIANILIEHINGANFLVDKQQ